MKKMNQDEIIAALIRRRVMVEVKYGEAKIRPNVINLVLATWDIALAIAKGEDIG